MKNIIFFLLLLTPITLIGQSSVQTSVNNFSAYWAFKNAGVSITIKNTADNKVIASHNSNLALSPASTMKLFSSASAMEILGTDYRPKTELYTNGEIDSNGVLLGNLILRALGDPTLGSKYFGTSNSNLYLDNWVKEINALGIKQINGQVIVDGSAFGYQGCPDGWNWSDMGNYYGAGPSAVIINDNILNYYFKTAGVGQKAVLLRTEPKLEGFRLYNDITGQKVSGDNSLIYGAPYSNDLYASGRLPYGRRNYKVKGSVPDPEKLLAKKLHDAISESGIKISGGSDFSRNRILNGESPFSYSSFTQLKSWDGKSIQEIAIPTNMKSINIFAEQFVCLVGYEKKGIGSTKNGIEYITKYWKEKLGHEHLHLKDGSGLSRSNAVNSNQFCDLLNYMSKSKNYEAYKSSLPIAGQSGTLRNVCKGQIADGRVFAKSGTMSRVKSYAGYVKTKSNKLLSFSLIVNNYNCSNSAVVRQMEKVFNAMAVY